MQRPIVNPLLLLLAIGALVGAAWLYVLGAAVKAAEQRASAHLKPKEPKLPSDPRDEAGLPRHAKDDSQAALKGRLT